MRSFSFFVLLSLLLACLVSKVVAGEIDVSFTNEDPISSNEVIADITLGKSLQGTITLIPAPSKPMRFTIISTVPQVIKPSHSRVSFSSFQSSVLFTLTSDPFGEIGFATIVISPEIRENQALYPPTSFEVLVRGFSDAEFSAGTECVASGVTNEIQLTIDPPAPETVSVVVQVVNGAVTPSTLSIAPGQSTARVQFVGGSIGQSSISFLSSIYETFSLNFTTRGQIVTSNPSRLVAGAPANVVVSLLPSNSMNVLIDIVGMNMNLPDSVVISAGSTANVGIIPISSGAAKITYTSLNYCDKIDNFLVSPAPICQSGFTPNYAGSACILCPGNNAALNILSNACSLAGQCTYSGCIQTSSRCMCDDGHFGSACQWSGESYYYNSEIIGVEAINITTSLPDTLLADFHFPAGFTAERDIGGTVLIGGLDASNSFYVDPTLQPPAQTVATNVGFYVEVLCADNTNDVNNFNSAASVDVNVDPNVFSQNQLGLTSLYYFDPVSRVWRDAATYCPSDEAFLNIDYIAMSISTTFCTPGQYNFFTSIPSVLPPNTGSPFNPHPSDSSLSGSRSTTGVGGVNPINPPLPVFTNNDNDPSPPWRVKNNFEIPHENLNFGVSSFSGFSSLLFALALLFLI